MAQGFDPGAFDALAAANIGFDLGAVANVDAMGNPTGVPNQGNLSPTALATAMYGNQISPLNPTFSLGPISNPHGWPALTTKGIPIDPLTTYTPEPMPHAKEAPVEISPIPNVDALMQQQANKEFNLESALTAPHEAMTAIQNQALANMTFNAYQDAVVANQTAPMSFADALNATLASMNPAMSAPDDSGTAEGGGGPGTTGAGAGGIGSEGGGGGPGGGAAAGGPGTSGMGAGGIGSEGGGGGPGGGSPSGPGTSGLGAGGIGSEGGGGGPGGGAPGGPGTSGMGAGGIGSEGGGGGPGGGAAAEGGGNEGGGNEGGGEGGE